MEGRHRQTDTEVGFAIKIPEEMATIGWGLAQSVRIVIFFFFGESKLLGGLQFGRLYFDRRGNEQISPDDDDGVRVMISNIRSILPSHCDSHSILLLLVVVACDVMSINSKVYQRTHSGPHNLMTLSQGAEKDGREHAEADSPEER